MKFSRTLEFARIGDAKEHYLAYAALKKAINHIAAAVAMEKVKGTAGDLNGLEDTFAKLFRDELTKANNYYEGQKKAFLSLANAGFDETKGVATEVSYLKVCALKEFLELNYAGFLKVLRSHDKYSKTLIQAKMQTMVEVSLPQADTDVLQAKIDALAQKYADTFCSGNGEMAKNKLAALWQERQTQAQATAWQELVERDRQTTVSAKDADESQPDKKAVQPAAPAAPHHKHNPYRVWQLLVLGVVFGGLLLYKPLADPTMNKCMAMCVLAIGLWITEAVPLYVTALSVPLLIVLLQLLRDSKGIPLDAKTAASVVASKMFSEVTLMLLGGFSIASATTKYGVARELAIFLLKLSGQSTGRLVAYLMFLAQFLSAFITNISAPMLCFSLLSSVLRAIPPGNRMGKQLVLAVSVASNLGGAISPMSSPQNVVAVGMLGGIGWLHWLAISVPFCAIASLGCWFVIMGRRGKSDDSSNINFARNYFVGGNFSWGIKEITVVVTILITIVMWTIKGIGANIFGNNGIVALLPVLVFFGSGMLGKEDFNSFPWNIVMLAIGGSLMGGAVDASGLLKMIADNLSIFRECSLLIQLALVAFWSSPSPLASLVTPSAP